MKVQFRSDGAKRFGAQSKNIDLVRKKDFTEIIINKAYDYARNLAPHDTGALKNAIQKIIQKNSGRVRLVQPSHRDGRNRPYHMWFHGIKAPSPTGKNSAGRGYDLRSRNNRPKSGIPNFMDLTYDYMESQTTKSIQEQVSQMFKKQ